MDQTRAEHNRPSCYGDLGTVFPMGPDGLREVPEDCTRCPHKIECLRRAVNRGEGAQEIGEQMARREQEQVGGVAGFVRRWSRLKSQKKGGS